MDNMTALVSCFVRAYHYRNSDTPVFADSIAEQMLTAEEYDAISRNMAQGIQYFAPGFQGTQGRIVHGAVHFLAVAGDEGDGVAFVNQRDDVFNVL